MRERSSSEPFASTTSHSHSHPDSPGSQRTSDIINLFADIEPIDDASGGAVSKDELDEQDQGATRPTSPAVEGEEEEEEGEEEVDEEDVDEEEDDEEGEDEEDDWDGGEQEELLGEQQEGQADGKLLAQTAPNSPSRAGASASTGGSLPCAAAGGGGGSAPSTSGIASSSSAGSSDSDSSGSGSDAPGRGCGGSADAGPAPRGRAAPLLLPLAELPADTEVPFACTLCVWMSRHMIPQL